MRKGKIALLIVLGVLVAARLAMNPVVKWYANRVLDQNETYGGRIADVDIHLWRGAYTLKGIRIFKRESRVPVPFFQTEQLDLSVGWREFFDGQIVARLKFLKPQINFVDGKTKADKQTGTEASWDEQLDKLAPFRIARLEVVDGSAHFRNFQSDPPVNVFVKDINGTLANLTNSKDKKRDLHATVQVTGKTMGGGDLSVNVKLDPRAAKPTFDLDAKLIGMDLKELNPFFKKYARLDFEKGRGDIIVQIVSKEGMLDGYVKPLFKHLQVFSLEKDLLHPGEGENIFTAAWQAVVGLVTSLTTNAPKDQFATRIPIHGPIAHPGTNPLTTVVAVLQNAFVRAFTPFYDKDLNLTAERKKAE